MPPVGRGGGDRLNRLEQQVSWFFVRIIVILAGAISGSFGLRRRRRRGDIHSWEGGAS